LEKQQANNVSQDQIREILRNYSVIAVVGLSDDKGKPSYRVASYMKQNGYRIIPVNPFIEETLGERSFPSLLEIPSEIQKTIEIVDIFRRAEDVLPIVEQAVKLKEVNGKPFVVWMQQGIINNEAAEKARKAGLIVIMDKCVMVEHGKL
jgi:predicted CoA-binding protein